MIYYIHVYKTEISLEKGKIRNSYASKDAHPMFSVIAYQHKLVIKLRIHCQPILRELGHKSTRSSKYL